MRSNRKIKYKKDYVLIGVFLPQAHQIPFFTSSKYSCFLMLVKIIVRQRYIMFWVILQEITVLGTW